MQSGERVIRVKRVIELGSEPAGGGVAEAAIMRQVGLQVIGALRCIEGRLMACIASRWSALEVVVDMAGGAVQCGMHAGEGKAGHFKMIEFGSKPVVHRVAILTGGGEA